MAETTPLHTPQDRTDDLQALIASLDDIVFSVNARQVFLNVWVRDESMLFMPKEEFLGKKIADVMGPLGPIMENLISKVLHTNTTQEVRYKHIDPAVTQYFRVRASIYHYDSDPEECKLALMVRDITEQHQQEQMLTEVRAKLERSNALLEDSQEISHSGAWDYTLATGDIFWTKNTYNIYDIPHGTKLKLQDILDLYVEEDSKKLQAVIQEAIEQKEKYNIVLRSVTGKYIHIFGMPIIEGGNVVKLRGAVRDISAQMEQRMDLVDAMNRAEDASQAKTQYLSIMSHEIRTPLNGIIGIANLLGINPTDEQKELVDNLIFSSNHLLQLVNDILDLNKIESDKLELIIDTVDIRQLAESIQMQFKEYAADKGLKVFVEVGEKVPNAIMADPVRLGQILNNLVSNGIKFTDKGGVYVSIRQQQRTDDKTTLHFSVRDTGIGIAPEHHEAVFENFRQVQQEGNRKQGGTGLGLAIVQRLVKLHGGTIALKSARGEGTEFTFELTFDLPEQGTDTQKKLHDLAAYKHLFAELNLLLVEDNPVNTLVARKQLEHFGITPDCAANGVQALELMQEKEYDIALVDLHMPEMDGFQLAAHIRSTYPEVYIVVFTADIMPEAKERLAKLNVHDILSKPFVPQQMFNIMMKVLLLKV